LVVVVANVVVANVVVGTVVTGGRVVVVGGARPGGGTGPVPRPGPSGSVVVCWPAVVVGLPCGGRVVVVIGLLVSGGHDGMIAPPMYGGGGPGTNSP
jgi:hypothetical protein